MGRVSLGLVLSTDLENVGSFVGEFGGLAIDAIIKLRLTHFYLFL